MDLIVSCHLSNKTLRNHCPPREVMHPSPPNCMICLWGPFVTPVLLLTLRNVENSAVGGNHPHLLHSKWEKQWLHSTNFFKLLKAAKWYVCLCSMHSYQSKELFEFYPTWLHFVTKLMMCLRWSCCSSSIQCTEDWNWWNIWWNCPWKYFPTDILIYH